MCRFPEQVFTCQLLETLTLNNNHITYIPSGIKTLCHLEVFHISKNPIRYISNKIKEWTSIKDICLDWISYINFEATTDNSRAEEEKNQDLWRVIKLVLFYNIEEIISKRESKIETPDWGHNSKENNVLVKSNIPITVKEKSLSFIQFLEESLKIIHQNMNISLQDPLFMNGGNALHMAVELNHLDFIQFLAFSQIPVNTVNLKGETPFHIAVSKKNRLMKIKLLKILNENNLSPMASFSARYSPLLICLEQNDIDTSHILIENDLFVSDFLAVLSLEARKEEYLSKILIWLFKLFFENYNKAVKVADTIIDIFGGNVLQSRKGINPILEAWSEGRFQWVSYVIEKGVVIQWDKLVDQLGKNIFHYACECNEYGVIKKIIQHIFKNNDTPYECLSNLIYKHCAVQGLPPKLYADPHRVIWKYLVYLEKLVSKQCFKQRKIGSKNWIGRYYSNNKSIEIL